MTDHYDADLAATELLARCGGRMNEQLYGDDEEGSRMIDKPEITVDKEFLDGLDALAEKAAAKRPTPWQSEQAGPSRQVSDAGEDPFLFAFDEAEVIEYVVAASPDVVRALVEELRVRENALEIAAAPFRLFCDNAGGSPRCPLSADVPSGLCGPDIKINSEACKRLRVEHACREARAQLEADHE